VVVEPPDLAKALDADRKARAAFEGLPFGLKRKHLAAIEEAKTDEVRQRRIGKLVTAFDREAASPSLEKAPKPARPGHPSRLSSLRSRR
jgi:uncharacterized protein YdeI (YjbR/CyaY-like superfamily)